LALGTEALGDFLEEKEKILLADDEPQILAMLSEFLGGLGYAVRAVGDGQEAMKAVQEEEFHLALLDLTLPDLSGLDLLSNIKARAPDTEVILFTGYGGMDSAVQALRLGAYDYLVKSELRLNDLQAVVARALERRRLDLSNRELMTNLRQAQQEISRQRSKELSQVRRIGEALAGPLTWEQLSHGMLNLIWEGLPLKALGIEFQGGKKDLSLEAYRFQPGLEEDTVERFKVCLKRCFQLSAEGVSDPLEDQPSEMPISKVLWGKAQAGESLALLAGGRDTAFTPEESELFRIFILQVEAALKNLELFEEVKNLAIRDGLTGLYNYRYFWELLAHEVEECKRYQTPLSLLFLDLDNFKVVNDTLGHSNGDLLLKTLADCLRNSLRYADGICRYGGEEFVALLPQTALDQAMKLAERLRNNISQMIIPFPERDLQFSVSIGVSVLTPDMDGEALVDAADAAMYRAKQAGKNQICGPEVCHSPYLTKP
jgi:two-component system cell cycle response regulator